MEYVASGNVYFGFEVDDHLLPHVISMIGDDKLIYASDIPHGDREWDSVVKFAAREDVGEDAKQNLLVANGRRYYKL
jgi:predicted TIM-barrel fold metal-dependent hydrolase